MLWRCGSADITGSRVRYRTLVIDLHVWHIFVPWLWSVMGVAHGRPTPPSLAYKTRAISVELAEPSNPVVSHAEEELWWVVVCGNQMLSAKLRCRKHAVALWFKATKLCQLRERTTFSPRSRRCAVRLLWHSSICRASRCSFGNVFPHLCARSSEKRELDCVESCEWNGSKALQRKVCSV